MIQRSKELKSIGLGDLFPIIENQTVVQGATLVFTGTIDDEDYTNYTIETDEEIDDENGGSYRPI